MKPKEEKPKTRSKAEKGRRRPARSTRTAQAGVKTAGAGKEKRARKELPSPPAGLAWEELGVMRETFLARFTVPEDAMALRRLARLFYLMVLEFGDYFPNEREAPVTVMLRAAALDLKGLSEYLADRELSVSREELALHALADRASGHLAALAAELADAAGEPPEADRAWWSPPYGKGEARAELAGG